ncbi:histidine--tRNA ligase [Hoeflea prorocentri]|uniref:Histidine--tRNA ligase n=1 Tax=Hoeflea prorocentri TaxID=1922333 RepID=A0A9X3ZIB8_9HYPH|nr:histidine--tRNA ligase [Hoeflea prorocentri]MCY6382274.1 histidine--tRNA ligase [Hoeflea prorocentri]MDA5400074.1 histidine--tRNA ligase [Hoeflea prorocentri]
MGEKKKKQPKLKARLPRGFVDRSPADIRATDEMVASIRDVFELYGFDPVETPMFEYTDALGKFLPDSDRPNEGVFSLTDDDDQWMSLRYDLTAPLARHVAENFNDIQLPYRTYRAGWVFRNEKPGPGRFRQFMQFDADTVGAPGVQADAEMCMMMADTMEALGIVRGDYVIRVNNRKVLDGVMEAIGIGGAEHAETRLTVLRAIDKLDKFGTDGVRLLLGEGRKDESGDFTKGAGLDDASVERVIGFVSAGGANGAQTIDNLRDVVAVDSASGSGGIGELEQIANLVAAAGYDDGRVKIDPSVVRGLEYYTGPVYEAELLFDVTNEKGQTVQFGSVGGGGRYDGLVSRFMGQPVPATGFSIGVSRLMTALKNLGKLGRDEIAAPVVVCVMDRDAESMSRYQRFVSELRSAGVRAEMFQGNPKNFGKQLQYADRRGSPVAIIQGSQERDEGTVQIKDLIEGKRLSGEIEDNAAWRASRPAQYSVKETDFVTEVKKLLAAQAEDRKAG